MAKIGTLAIPGLLLLWEYWFVQHNDLGQLGILASGVLLVANLAYLLMTCVGWSVRSHYAERAGWIIRAPSVSHRLRRRRPATIQGGSGSP